MNKPGAAVSRSRTRRLVAFSWEQEPGVSKQSPTTEAKKPAALGAEVSSKRTTTKPASTKIAAAAEEPRAHPHRLRVPPPPGGPGAPAVSPPGRTKPRNRGVKPGNDPFLAAYLACKEGGNNGGQKFLGLGYGLGLSCRSSYADVEQSVVRLPKTHPKSSSRK